MEEKFIKCFHLPNVKNENELNEKNEKRGLGDNNSILIKQNTENSGNKKNDKGENNKKKDVSKYVTVYDVENYIEDDIKQNVKHVLNLNTKQI
jgi:hypothetical protein